MALDTGTGFIRSFDITDKTQDYDISPVLLAALMADTGILGVLPFGAPVYDTTHYWNEIALNAGQVTVDGTGYNSAQTTVVLAAGQGVRVRAGAILKRLTGSDLLPELSQVTAVATDTLTVTRAYGGTTASNQTFTANGVIDIVSMPLQEASDIQTDSTVLPSVLQNYTEIKERSIKISRNQLKRRMAAVQDLLAQSIHDRTMEIKRELEKTVIHSAKAASSASGSSTVYRTMDGLFNLITAGAALGAAWTYANHNTAIKTIVDAGAADDMSRLVVVAPTRVRQAISGFDSSNRRLLESDRRQGYFVEQVVSDTGVVTDVVTSNYLGNTSPGVVMVVDVSRASIRPFADDTFKLMAAEDWVDGVKRRILGEYTLELFQGSAAHYKNWNVT